MKTIKSHIHTVSLTMFQYYTLPTLHSFSLLNSSNLTVFQFYILPICYFTLFQSNTLPIFLSKIQN